MSFKDETNMKQEEQKGQPIEIDEDPIEAEEPFLWADRNIEKMGIDNTVRLKYGDTYQPEAPLSLLYNWGSTNEEGPSLLETTKSQMTIYHKKLVAVPVTEYFPERTAEFQQTNEEHKAASATKAARTKAARKQARKTQQDLDSDSLRKLEGEYSSMNVNLTARNIARTEIAKVASKKESPLAFEPELLPARHAAFEAAVKQNANEVATNVIALKDKRKIIKNAVPTAGLEKDGRYGYGRRDLTGYERRENEKKLSGKAKGAKAGSSVEKTAKKDVQNLFMNMYVDLALNGKEYLPEELQDAVDATYFSELFQNDFKDKSDIRLGIQKAQLDSIEKYDIPRYYDSASKKEERLERKRWAQDNFDEERILGENLGAIFQRINSIGTNNILLACDNLRQIEAMDKARAVLLLDEPSEYRDLMIKVLDEKQATMRIEHQTVIKALLDPAPPSLAADGTETPAGRVATRMKDVVRELAILARQVPAGGLQTTEEQLAVNDPAYHLIMRCARES